MPNTRHRRRPARRAPADGRGLLADEVLAYLATQTRPLKAREIRHGLDLPRALRRPLKNILNELADQGQLERVGEKAFVLAGDSGLLEAVIDQTPHGHAFALVKEPGYQGKDPYISSRNLGQARHGDRVLIRILGQRRGRPEARVARLLERGQTRLCGIYMGSGKLGYVTPDDDRIPYTVLIRRGRSLGAQDNTVVAVEILDHGDGSRSPEGRVIEILGRPDSVDVQMRLTLWRFGLQDGFPDEVLAEAEALEPITECGPDRLDLRDLPHVTIDGEDSKDFDDAICVEETGEGFRLYVSIADVAHYVRPGSALDREAFRRGTSVYLPGRVVPMLPERLSNDLCSLVPHEDRPAFTARLDFDARGRLAASAFSKSLIRSRARLTYTAVRRILDDRDPMTTSRYQPLVPMLGAAGRLAEILHQRRMARGSIGFTVPEAEVRLEGGDRVGAIVRAERNMAHGLIEEMMLAANEAVAAALEGRAFLYRIHELPDPAKIEAFRDTARVMGLDLPPGDPDSAWFGRVLESVAGTPAEYVINNLLLRTMQKARYAPENAGHFGLASACYTHFTSPIRRYPDLIAHRALEALTQGRPDPGPEGLLPQAQPLREAGDWLSARERAAIDAERDAQARLAALFMADHVGEEFTGIISGVASFGLFVELFEHMVSGAVPVRDLVDDYYVHDGRGHRFIGERSGRVYRMGQVVRVRVARVDHARRRIGLQLLPDGPEGGF